MINDFAICRCEDIDYDVLLRLSRDLLDQLFPGLRRSDHLEYQEQHINFFRAWRTKVAVHNFEEHDVLNTRILELEDL
jgi:hypothetical protein